jgi:hypothetical protein
LASHNFNDGTLGPFENPWGVDLQLVADPTGSGRGKIARFHYAGTDQDRNRALAYSHPRGFGQPLFFRGDFYLPLSDLALSQRKLIYWQSHGSYTKYTTNGGLATGNTVVKLMGNSLEVDAGYKPAASTGKTADDVRTWATIATLEGNQWYTLEVEQTMESSLGAKDGVLRIWLNGTKLFEKATMSWADPAWVGDTTNSVPFQASDIYFETFLVGDQVNWTGTYDEYRYWDNIAFSTRRITN